MKHLHCFTLLILSVSILTGALYAQGTFFKLTTVADSTDPFSILNSENVTRMQVNSDGGFYLGGIYNTGVIPKEGAGARLMWYPRKAAFRAGYINGTQWDNANIGTYSIAMGNNSTANGQYSIAMGRNATASEISSTAIGQDVIASGAISVAMGDGTEASGSYSTAMGRNTTASGYASTAMGYATTASGISATAMGNQTTASGNISTAMGYAVTTNNHTGSFIIGDSSGIVISSSLENQMTMRFSSGYRLYTNASGTAGVYMNGGANGWSNYCDRNKKENFRPIDGEQILTKIKEMPITEWNYKGTDKSVKYIGPVAQDFYSAFHLGGTDSLGINTICIDGVNIAAIQALEKRTAELQKANDKIELMEKRIEKLEQMIISTKTNNK